MIVPVNRVSTLRISHFSIILLISLIAGLIGFSPFPEHAGEAELSSLVNQE